MNLKGVKLNLNNIFLLSRYFRKRLKSKFNKPDMFIGNTTILSAYYGIPSPFCPPIDKFSKKYKKDSLNSYKKVGEAKLVAGQEDLIPEIIKKTD